MGLFFLLIISLIYSFFMITIANIALLLLALIYQYTYRGKTNVSWFPVVLMILGFLPYFIGLFTSLETNRALRAIQHNLAYLSLPLTIILLPSLTSGQRHNVFGFYILIVSISTVPVFWNYMMNFDEVTLSLGSGKAIPTPIDHVRYSIMVAIACVFSSIMFIRREKFFDKNGRRFFLFMSIYLFLTVHVLAVRSGIGLTYIGLILSGTLLLFQAKKYVLIALLWGGMAISPILAYYAIPSFQNKIKYTRYDLSLSKSGQGAGYSDSERLRSYKIGLDIWNDYKILGIGTGDLRREVGKRYFERYTEGGRAFSPHNQVIKLLASSGLLGLFFFLISFFMPFFWRKKFTDPYVLALIGIIFVSFMIEATLERSYMLSLYLLLAALLYRGEPSSDVS